MRGFNRSTKIREWKITVSKNKKRRKQSRFYLKEVFGFVEDQKRLY